MTLCITCYVFGNEGASTLPGSGVLPLFLLWDELLGIHQETAASPTAGTTINSSTPGAPASFTDL